MEVQQESSYSEIKGMILDAYYDYCRSRGVVKHNPYEDILGIMEEDHENALEADTEKFMLHLVELVLSAGMHEGFENRMRNYVLNFLGRNDVMLRIKLMPDQTKGEFLDDLRRLGFLAGTPELKSAGAQLPRELGYSQVKEVVLGEMFSLCRDEGILKRTSFFEINLKLAERLREIFPSENIFLDIFKLVMTAGLCPDLESQLRKSIRHQLSLSVHSLLAHMDEEDAHLFRSDVALLRLLQ